MPMITNAFGGWLNYPEYFFFWCYHGQNAVFNTMGYKNPAMDALIDKARFTTGPEYEAAVKGFIDMAFEEVPRVPIYQPLLNVAMQKNVTGYRYWFHRQLDYRQLAKGLTGVGGHPERGPPGPLMIMMRTWRSALRP